MLDVGSDPETETATEPVATLGELRAAARVIGRLMARIDADSVPLSQSGEYWKACNEIVRAGEVGTTLLARRVDASDVWKKAGCPSGAAWRAREGGTGLGDARRQGTASKQLEDLPDTSDALRKGELSADQVEAISDAATANPNAEQDLIDSAKKKGLGDLKGDCGRAKQQGDRDPDATRRRIKAEQRFGIGSRTDGSALLYGNGPVDEAAVLQAALQPIVDRYYRERRGTPQQAERQSYMWDAFIELARGRIDGPAPAPGADGDTKTKTKTRTDYLAILRVDLAALIRGWVEGDEVCEIPGLGQVPISRLREMLPESSIRLVITKGIAVQTVTNLGRGANAAQKIALMWSQPGCTNIACSHTWTQDDHRDPYAQVKRTDLGNLDPLCPHCHDLKTYQGWALVNGTGRRAFVAPTDPRHPKHARPRAGPEPPDAPDAQTSDHGDPPDQLF